MMTKIWRIWKTASWSKGFSQ